MPMTKFKPRPIADPKYQQALLNMGVGHGGDWDCNRECKRCQPFRDIERQVWNTLTEEEQHAIRFTRYGI
jgi:hypothetical protein